MLEVKKLKTVFSVGDKSVTAVNEVSFSVPEQSVVGLVGESGSGKSVTSLSILNILPPNGSIKSGEILWNGKNLLTLSKAELTKIRGKEIGLIFQDPLAALNPVFTVGNQLIETIRLHQNVDKDTAKQKAIELLRTVHIPDPESRVDQYPHEFSIGMCQRVMIALTLSMNPKLIIADEPTASLDVTIQAQVLLLLKQLKDKFKLSILLISHDLGVIAQHCDYILIMYLGKIVEKGTPLEIFGSPLHPYTQALIQAIPLPDPTQKQVQAPIKGELPSPMSPPSGCPFHTRCPHVMPRCRIEEPQLLPEGNAEVACFLYDKAKR